MIGSSWDPLAWLAGAWVDGSWANAGSQPATTSGGGYSQRRPPRAGGASYAIYPRAPRRTLDERPQIIIVSPSILDIVAVHPTHQSSASVEQSLTVTVVAQQRPHASESQLEAAPFAEDEELFVMLAAA